MTERIDFLELQDLIEIATRVVPNVQFRDLGLLESAAARPQSTIFGEAAYPSFELKVCALLHSVVRNHALVDGNKRLAWSAARVFCLLNNRDLVMSVDDAESMIVGAASGEFDVVELSELIRNHLVAITLKS